MVSAAAVPRLRSRTRRTCLRHLPRQGLRLRRRQAGRMTSLRCNKCAVAPLPGTQAEAGKFHYRKVVRYPRGPKGQAAGGEAAGGRRGVPAVTGLFRPAPQTLRDYQSVALDAIRAKLRAGGRSILLV